MFVAIVGCGHGEIDKIYEVITKIEEERNIKVDLLLCCGDFQSVRNMTDLRCMACPVKYQAMHDFHRYYSGEKKAPVLTLFIGGNHEASNFLQELPYGGWVAPNFYYLGYSSVVKFGPLRIGGVSGIYKGHDYLKGRHECPPYDHNSMRSVYHYRNLDIFRLKQIKSGMDIFLSHDWPKGIHDYGNTQELLRRKPFFRSEIEKNELGGRPLFELMCAIKPKYWFSAHLHVKFAAIFPHENTEPNKLNSEIKESTDKTEEKLNEVEETNFLALDKVLPRRQFLQILEIANDSTEPQDLKLSYDKEWLSILKSTNHLVSAKNITSFMPGPGYPSRFDFAPSEEELKEIELAFEGNYVIPENFEQTAPSHEPNERPLKAQPTINPQTRKLCEKLEITDPLRIILSENPSRLTLQSPLGQPLGYESPSMGQRENLPFEYVSQLDITYNESSFTQVSLNPDEISLDLEEEADDDDAKGANNESLEAQRSHLNSSLTGNCRKKLLLPPPIDSIANSCGLNTSNEERNRQLLEELGEPVEPTNPLQLDSGMFFAIDKEGVKGQQPEEGPSNKKRRNEDLYKQLEDENN